MKIDLTPYVAAVIAGSPLNQEAKKAGVNSATLHRLVVKDPDYVKAKEDGRIRRPGLPGKPQKLLDEAHQSPAVAEVLAGSTITAAALRHGIPVSSLTKMVHIVRPGVNMKTRRGEDAVRAAERKLEKARKALEEAINHATPP
jgi:hypothetical protein